MRTTPAMMGVVLGVTVALIPLVYLPWAYRPTPAGKQAVLIAATLALTWLWARHLIRESSLRWVSSPLIRPLLAFLGAVLISAALSPVPPVWLGWDQHREGAATFLLYGLIFVSALQATRSEPDLRRLLGWLPAGLGLTAATALLQPLWGSPISPFRATGTFGDPNQLGGYLLLLLPFTLLGYSNSATRRRKLACLVLGLAGYASLALTFSKIAYAGALVQLVVLGGSYLSKQTKRRPVALGVAGALGGLIAARLISPGSLGQVGFSAIQTNLGARFDAWTTAWNLARERPAFGWGPDSYHFISQGAGGFGGAHSEYLYYLATLGAAGLGAFLAILVALAFVIRSHPKARGEDHAIRLATLASIAGYLVYLTTTYNQPYIAAVFWMVLAVAARAGPAAAERDAPERGEGRAGPRAHPVLATMIPLLLVLALGSQLLRLPAGSLLLGAAFEAWSERSPAEALPLAQSALNLVPDSEDAWMVYGLVNDGAAELGSAHGRREAIKAYRVVVERHDPGDAETWARLARTYYFDGNNPAARRAGLKAKSLGVSSPGLERMLRATEPR